MPSMQGSDETNMHTLMETIASMTQSMPEIDAQLTVNIARYFLTAGSLDQSEAAIRSLIPQQDRSREAHVLLEVVAADLIQAYVARRDIATASRLLEDVSQIEQTRESVPLARAAASVARARGDFALAAQHLKRVVLSTQATGKDWVALARVHEAAGDVAAAIQSYLCAAQVDTSHASILNIAARIATLASSESSASNSSRVRIAIIGSSTLHDIQSYLEVFCRIAGLKPEFYLGPYGQYAQDILDPASRLYAFQPDIVIAAIHGTAIFPRLYNEPFDMDIATRRAAAHEAVERTVSLLQQLTAHTRATVLLHTFATPQYSPIGVLDLKDEFGQTATFHAINDALAERVRREFPMVHLVDEERVYGRIGKANATDPRMWFLGRIGIGEGALGALTNEYMRFIKAYKGRTRKCLVLDLDNTLWGGVIGEDGPTGIALGQEAPGNAYVAFQESILNLYKRGIILAINSKNNQADAMEVLERHPDMVLRPQHFAAMRINWRDKASNLRSIADELNIGLDGIVFIDDNPAECALVRAQVPEVLTVELPRDPALYRSTLLALSDFDSLALTDEDRQRGRLYAQRRERHEWEASHANNLDAYLSELEMVVEVMPADEFALPRIAQLIGKTNQFNLTTRRHPETTVREFWHSDTSAVYAVRVRDRFGDHGLVGTMITDRHGDVEEVDTFLLSCRVLGRGVETAMLSTLAAEARRHGTRVLRGVYVPTAKNAPAQEFYRQHGFTFVAEDATTHAQSWDLDVTNASVNAPSWVAVKSVLPAQPAAR